MGLAGNFIRSRVGRRMLLYFVLSALLPILFLAVLYFEEIGGLLDRQAHANLEIATKSYRTSLYERLLLVDELLRSAVAVAPSAPMLYRS